VGPPGACTSHLWPTRPLSSPEITPYRSWADVPTPSQLANLHRSQGMRNDQPLVATSAQDSNLRPTAEPPHRYRVDSTNARAPVKAWTTHRPTPGSTGTSRDRPSTVTVAQTCRSAACARPAMFCGSCQGLEPAATREISAPHPRLRRTRPAAAAWARPGPHRTMAPTRTPTAPQRARHSVTRTGRNPASHTDSPFSSIQRRSSQRTENDG
jgi:hypothetical protein